jgi:hypothetical protein
MSIPRCTETGNVCVVSDLFVYLEDRKTCGRSVLSIKYMFHFFSTAFVQNIFLSCKFVYIRIIAEMFIGLHVR